ncbi:MAG: ATP-dependent DNA helicase RecG [Clostridia bacterium]|nr:ATP-dependent DNA helicase RecG [Clostridia bacterium]
MKIDLNKEVQFVKGVGPNRVKLLNKLNIYTLKDLITYFPRNHEDRSIAKKIVECIDGETVLIKATALTKITEIRARRLSIYKLVVNDESSSCVITWFNQKYLKDKFKVGETYTFFGKIENKGGTFEMKSPVFDEEGVDKNTGKIVPIYPLTSRLSQNVLRKIIESGIDEVYGNLEESIPDYILQKYRLLGINEAYKNIHFPSSNSDFIRAKNRLVFEELLALQLALFRLKEGQKYDEKGIKFDSNIKMQDVIETLPFTLTNAQKRVLNEIDKDMEKDTAMNRLLQGDVGSGKTVVSIVAAYKAVKSGYQAAIMAPTAILADQHLKNFTKMLEPFGIKCELLVSSVTKKNKELILERLKNGEIDILIGTHALLEDNVVFKNLGLVVTDEQHRFGVKQRATIVAKGNNPDVIVMSATPIPRTLALILYGDLDISIIDELPPNRKKIETYAVGKDMEERIVAFVKKLIGEGRQAYIVCPLVEDSDDMDLKSVTALAEKYKTEVFSEYRVEYLHGKMKSKEKDDIMQRFKNGEIDILISTTVIEVGVDVPNASIMIIENAERFGLAQLHQLRGRVGRGEYKSYCILKNEGHSKVCKERMKVMCQTNDGFVISEKDLELRGSGDFFGTAQHGVPELKIANLFENIRELKEVQELASHIIADDPNLEQEKNFRLKSLIEDKFTSRIEI